MQSQQKNDQRQATGDDDANNIEIVAEAEEENAADGALVRVDCEVSPAVPMPKRTRETEGLRCANKCLVLKMSHMAFCMWRPPM